MPSLSEHRSEPQDRVSALPVRILKGVARWVLLELKELLVVVFVLLPLVAVLEHFVVGAAWPLAFVREVASLLGL